LNEHDEKSKDVNAGAISFVVIVVTIVLCLYSTKYFTLTSANLRILQNTTFVS